MANDIITGSQFMDWLEEQGVVPPDRPLRRVIIDAPYDGPVTIYWEELGTRDLIKDKVPQALLEAGLVRIESEIDPRAELEKVLAGEP